MYRIISGTGWVRHGRRPCLDWPVRLRVGARSGTLMSRILATCPVEQQQQQQQLQELLKLTPIRSRLERAFLLSRPEWGFALPPSGASPSVTHSSNAQKAMLPNRASCSPLRSPSASLAVRSPPWRQLIPYWQVTTNSGLMSNGMPSFSCSSCLAPTS
jgi:hypothetical protein